jgi:hypothetical protein
VAASPQAFFKSYFNSILLFPSTLLSFASSRSTPTSPAYTPGGITYILLTNFTSTSLTFPQTSLLFLSSKFGMHSAQVFFLLALLISTVVATPIRQPTHLQIARAKARYEARQEQRDLTGPVSFQTVTTTETYVGYHPLRSDLAANTMTNLTFSRSLLFDPMI